MTPFVQQAQALLAEREQATTPEGKRDAEARLAALIQANYQGRAIDAQKANP